MVLAWTWAMSRKESEIGGGTTDSSRYHHLHNLPIRISLRLSDEPPGAIYRQSLRLQIRRSITVPNRQNERPIRHGKDLRMEQVSLRKEGIRGFLARHQMELWYYN